MKKILPFALLCAVLLSGCDATTPFSTVIPTTIVTQSVTPSPFSTTTIAARSTIRPYSTDTPEPYPIYYPKYDGTTRGSMIFEFHYRGGKSEFNSFRVFIEPLWHEKMPVYQIQEIYAAFLLENEKIYRYVGNGNSWDWEILDIPVEYQNESNIASWKVHEETYLGTWNQFSFVFQITNLANEVDFTTNVNTVMYTH